MIVRALEGRAHPRSPEYWVEKLFGRGLKTATGREVTHKDALSYTPYWAAVNIIAGGVGMLPLHVYVRERDGGRRRASESPLQRLVHDRPNPYMTAQVFRETIQAHVLTWGNGYAEIERGGAGQPRALWPLLPDRTGPHVSRDGRRLWYTTRGPDGTDVTLAAENVLHVPGFGWDGVKGYPALTYHAEALAMGLEARRYGAHFFRQGAAPGGAYKHPGQISDTAYGRLRESLSEGEHSIEGVEAAHRALILEEGMEWDQIGVPAKEAQLIEARKFSPSDVARIFQIPPHMLADLEKATFSNIEHQGIEFVRQTLLRWLRRWENEGTEKLFGRQGRRTHYLEFLVEGFLRGDTESRYKAYRIGRQWGWLSINDVRALENLNPVEGGDDYMQPLNMVPVGAGGGGQGGDGGGAGEGGVPRAATVARVAGAAAEPLAATLDRLLRKELNDARRARQGRDGEAWEAWVDRRCRQIASTVREALAPEVRAAAEGVWAVLSESPMPAEATAAAEEILGRAAAEHCEASRARLLAAADRGPDRIRWVPGRGRAEALEIARRVSESLAQVADRGDRSCAKETSHAVV